MSEDQANREFAEYAARREHADIDIAQALEPTLTVAQIAKVWQKSEDTVRRIFQSEPGVLQFGHPTLREGRKYRRRYYTLRVPLSVFKRVEDRLRKGR